MDKSGKFLLPSPKFKKLDKPSTSTPHFLTPEGMLLPREKQPPPMYGPRGATLPPQFLGPQRVPGPNSHADKSQKFFCEPCEAEFHTSTDYKVHRSEHTQCEIDKCSFNGHPSFMDTHIAQQHATGLYDQLKKLSTPEEIAQWRAERKKNYPTVACVQQKEKAREQRMLRGEKLAGNKSRFGRQSDRRQIRGDKQEMGEHVEKPAQKKRQRKRIRPVKQGPKREGKDVFDEKAIERKEEDEPMCGGLKMFKGTGGMPDYKKPKKTETHALSSLLGMYGSGSEEESENNDEEQGKFEETTKLVAEGDGPPKEEEESENNDEQGKFKETTKLVAEGDGPPKEDSLPETVSNCITDKPTPEHISQVILKVPEKAEEALEKSTEQHSSDDEAPEEAPIAKSSNVPDKPQSEPPRKKPKQDPPKRSAPRSGLDYRKLRGGRQNTMLEKLLESDIRHERNVLLQCVRFVVENNFFGIGSTTPET